MLELSTIMMSVLSHELGLARHMRIRQLLLDKAEASTGSPASFAEQISDLRPLRLAWNWTSAAKVVLPDPGSPRMISTS